MSVTPRDAATVMLIRDAEDEEGRPAVEVCMLRRNLTSEFVAGAYVFPGGSVDPDDRGAAAASLCRGLTDAEASAILGVGSGGLAFWVAAVRECFEEAGVLVAARDAPGHDDLLDTSDPAVARRFAGHRDALNEGRTGLGQVCRDEGLVLAVDSMYYISHWITPELAPRRYDTRFFITAAPPGQVARHDDGETIATIWVRPDLALASEAAGEIALLPPTIANLAAIEPCRSTGAVMAWAAQVTEVPTVLPIVLFEDGQVVILRPGDDGYERALADRQASGLSADVELADATRALWGPNAGPA